MAKKKSSITYTAIIWVGNILAIFGAGVAALGIGGVATFSLKWDTFELNSTSIGVIIMLAGIFLALYMATHLPKGVHVLMKQT